MAGLLAAAVLVAACGSDDGNGTGTETTDRPAGGGDISTRLRFGHNRAPTTGFDPHRATLPHDDIYLKLVYEPLINETVTAELAPGLATEWAFVDDGTALELTLREGVTFHDGAAFDAEAVRANLDRARTLEGSAVAGDVRVMENVEVLAPDRVRIELSAPAAGLPRLLSSRLGMMISPDALEASDLDVAPVGAGMFQLVDYRQGDRALFERFDEYWAPEDVAVDEFEIVLMTDPMSRLNALRNGEIDIGVIDPNQKDAAESDGLQTVVSEGMNRQLLQFNRTRSEFGDVRVRQALNYAVDRQSIADAVYGGFAVTSAQMYTAVYPFAHVEELADSYPYDPERARELLADAGLGDGFEFELLVSTDPLRERIAEIVQAQYAEVGVTMRLRSVEVTALGDTFYRLLEGDAIIAEILGGAEPTQLSGQMFLEGQFTNPGGHEIERVTEAHWQASASAPDEERHGAVQELMTAIVEEAGVVMFVHPLAVYGVTPRVEGFGAAVPGFPSFRGVSVSD